MLALRHRFNVEQLANPGEQRFDVEWFLEEVVRTGVAELLNFVFFDHAGDTDDSDIVHRGIAADKPADFDAVDIWEHDVEYDQVWPEFLDHHASTETIVDAADIEAAVAFELVDNEFDQIFVVVDDEDFSLAAIEGIGGDAVVAHEGVQLVAGDAAEPATRHAESFKLTGIEATNNRLLANFTNFGGFASGEDGFHSLNHPSP